MAGQGAWFWDYWKIDKNPDAIDYMNRNYKPNFAYADFANRFTAEHFNANEFADIVKSSGAK